MKGDTMNRYEVKYLVATERVPALIAEWSSYTRPDPHSEGEWGYPIYSVYWDTDDFRFFWEKVEGSKYRRKLRFRRYGSAPEVFIEIKQREDRTLQKRRRKAVVSKLKLEQRAKNTITASDVLLAEIDSIEKQQFSIDNQELYDDIIAIAVPIKDRKGRFYSSLAIQAPASRLSVHQSDRYLPLLREAADNLAMLAEDD